MIAQSNVKFLDAKKWEGPSPGEHRLSFGSIAEI